MTGTEDLQICPNSNMLMGIRNHIHLFSMVRYYINFTFMQLKDVFILFCFPPEELFKHITFYNLWNFREIRRNGTWKLARWIVYNVHEVDLFSHVIFFVKFIKTTKFKTVGMIY